MTNRYRIPPFQSAWAGRCFMSVTLTVSVLAGCACAQPAAAPGKEATTCAGIMTPTDVANAAVADLLAAHAGGRIKTGQDQPRLLNKYLRLVTYNRSALPRNPVDRAALGDLFFLNFRPVEADELFSGLLDRTDLIGRLAWQRAMQIRRQAFDRAVEVQKMIIAYRKKFPYVEDDVFGVSQQIAGFAGTFFADGRSDKAIDLILEEIRMTPATGPYRTFTLYKLFKDQIKRSNRENEIKSLLSSKLVELKRLRDVWASSEISAGAELRHRASAPQWYWLFQRVDPAESIRAARRRQLNELISDLHEYVSA